MKSPNKKDVVIKTGLWILLVYVLSFVCYTPMLLNTLGVIIPNTFILLRYCFVLIPALVSIIFLVHERSLKSYLTHNFKRISLREIVLCAVVALIGIASTCCYSLIEKTDLYGSTYSSIPSLIFSCGYLLATALIEEMAWRGFLFDRLAVGEKKMVAEILVGVVWAVWHIPMWTIRNSLSISEMIPLFAWAVLISVVLGISYRVFRNIFTVSILHMVFNVCFLAPVKYNVVIILLSIIVCFASIKHKQFLERRKNDSAN